MTGSQGGGNANKGPEKPGMENWVRGILLDISKTITCVLKIFSR
jgi:hypothetical protein